MNCNVSPMKNQRSSSRKDRSQERKDGKLLALAHKHSKKAKYSKVNQIAKKHNFDS